MAPTPSPAPPRLFLDASVIVAALASELGASRVILTLAEAGLFRLVVCPHVLQEVERNLAKKLPDLLPLYRQVLNRLPLEWVEDPTPKEVKRWAAIIALKDAPILAAAVVARPQRLVTLDVHDFLTNVAVAEESGLTICTPRELLREIRVLLEQGITGP
jgi:predicted nucleic acid-binding protein